MSMSERAGQERSETLTRLDVGDHLDAGLVEMADHTLEVGVSFGVHGEDVPVAVVSDSVTRRKLFNELGLHGLRCSLRA